MGRLTRLLRHSVPRGEARTWLRPTPGDGQKEDDDR